MKLNAVFVFFKSFSAKHEKKKKKAKKKEMITVLYMENILKGSRPKMTGQNDRQDKSLTAQVHDQAGHCSLTGRYFEPSVFLPL